MQPSDELEELRIGLERIRTLLENLTVRGLRACGPDELAQIGSHAENLDQSGAGHLAAVLSELRSQIESDQRASAVALLHAQTNVRLLERLLTLRVVRQRYAAAIEVTEHSGSPTDTVRSVDDDEADEEVDED
jgi:hypothetical protein